MELTITQNGALYALQHRASKQQWNKAQIQRASARAKIPPPRLGVNTAATHKIETEEKCFISSCT